MKKQKQKTTAVLVRFSEEVKQEFIEVANFKGLSMSALVTMLIKEEYRKMKKEEEE